MKVIELIEKYNKNKMVKVEQLIEVKKYVPIRNKLQLAKEVFEASTNDDGGFIEVDSLVKYISFTLVMIMRHTNIEFSVNEDGMASDESIDEYDMLCENGLLDKIIETFEEDYSKCLDVLNMYFKDNMDSKNSTESILNRVSNSAAYSISTVTDKIIDTIDGLNLDTIQESLDKFVK